MSDPAYVRIISLAHHLQTHQGVTSRKLKEYQIGKYYKEGKTGERLFERDKDSLKKLGLNISFSAEGSKSYNYSARFSDLVSPDYNLDKDFSSELVYWAYRLAYHNPSPESVMAARGTAKIAHPYAQLWVPEITRLYRTKKIAHSRPSLSRDISNLFFIVDYAYHNGPASMSELSSVLFSRNRLTVLRDMFYTIPFIGSGDLQPHECVDLLYDESTVDVNNRQLITGAARVTDQELFCMRLMANQEREKTIKDRYLALIDHVVATDMKEFGGIACDM